MCYHLFESVPSIGYLISDSINLVNLYFNSSIHSLFSDGVSILSNESKCSDNLFYISQKLLYVINSSFFTLVEEFLLITTTKQEDEENSIFERIREKVENSVIKTEAGEISITISIGAASYINGKSGENLIYEADKALYTAKEEGRNRVKWRK